MAGDGKSDEAEHGIGRAVIRTQAMAPLMPMVPIPLTKADSEPDAQQARHFERVDSLLHCLETLYEESAPRMVDNELEMAIEVVSEPSDQDRYAHRAAAEELR